MLAAALNINHMLWKTGPSATELEQVSLGWLRQWLGLPEEFFGIIHDTASTADLHAVIAAREVAREVRRRSRCRNPEMVLYTSEHANLSIDRAASGGRCRPRATSATSPPTKNFACAPTLWRPPSKTIWPLEKRPFCVVPNARHHFLFKPRSAAGDRGDRAPLRPVASRRRSLCRARRRPG